MIQKREKDENQQLWWKTVLSFKLLPEFEKKKFHLLEDWMMKLDGRIIKLYLPRSQ